MHQCRPPALAHVVESIWEVAGTVANTRERIFPDGGIDLVMNLGPEQRLVRADGTAVFASGATWLSGIQRQPIVMESAAEVHVFAVRLRPAAAAILLNAPMRLVSGRTVPLREVRRDAAAVLARSDGSASFDDRAGTVCEWIEERCGAHPRCRTYLDWIAREIDSSGGALPIEVFRRVAGVSRKKLAADFGEQIGITPKVLARILRFRRARMLLQRDPVSFTDVAAACGYFDHAHMVREFRDLGGMTPSDFVAATYPDGQSAIA